MSAIVFLVTEDWYFVSHRLPLAVALRERGWTVTVATRCTGADARLREAGLEVVPLPWRRRGGSWRAELTAFRTVRRLVRERAPDVLHLVALKPTLFGAAAALGHRSTRVVAAIAGLGFLFTSDSLRARLLRPAFVRALGVLLARVDARVIVQNPEDRVA
ncbi:MAG TPA: glycosyltransferase, partial [Gemmatimonadales bacterium]|nr:glycosyltransferase [Gemmatimonadales bacterium]